MGVNAEKMVAEAVDVFLDQRHRARAEQLADAPTRSTTGARSCSTTVIARPPTARLRPWCMRMLIAARWFERIVDHAANVGERTIYRLTGERRPIDAP